MYPKLGPDYIWRRQLLEELEKVLNYHSKLVRKPGARDKHHGKTQFEEDFYWQNWQSGKIQVRKSLHNRPAAEIFHPNNGADLCSSMCIA